MRSGDVAPGPTQLRPCFSILKRLPYHVEIVSSGLEAIPVYTPARSDLKFGALRFIGHNLGTLHHVFLAFCLPS